MEKPETKETNIPVIRHFEDIDNLLNFGRDGDLISGQESKAVPIAWEIYAEAKKENKGAVMFICSDKKRAVQTASLIADQLRKIDDSLQIRIAEEEDLAAQYQGKFILPPDYKPGDPFTGLELANKIFVKETFSSNKGNYLYKFGDPVLQDDGSYKYPELAPYFESYGESNRDLLLRIYGLIVETYEKLDKMNSRTEVVVVVHAQLYQIFRDLSTVADMVKNGKLSFKTGELPKLCWDMYFERSKREKPTYGINYIAMESLRDSRVIELLKKEMEYLKNLK